MQPKQSPDKESRCKYQLPDQTSEAEYSCPYEMMSVDAPYCIFHVPKTREELDREFATGARVKFDLIRRDFNSGVFSHVTDIESRGDQNIIDCRGFRFPTSISFDCSFPRRIVFDYAVFEDVDFSRYYTSEGEKQVAFENGASFKGAEFRGDVTFDSAQFNSDVEFSYAVFRQSPDFGNAHFRDDAKFFNVTFESGANFRLAVFEQSADFFGSNFGKPDAVPEISFYRTDFRGFAEFGDVRFNSWVNLNRANFSRGASFSEAVFQEGAAFRGVTCSGGFTFAHATFKQKTLFQNCEFEGDTAFVGLDIVKDASVTFEKVNLGKASFEDTNLELISFRAVTWAMPRTRFRPFALWDEFRPENANYERDYEKIAENYRQLVINYEKKRDYDSAEIFHIGEMETRRKRKADVWRGIAPKTAIWLKEWFNSYGLYRLLSTYGTSYWQALLVLAFFILISSVSFMYAGFETENPPSRVIEYNIITDTAHVPVSAKEWMTDYKEAVSYSLSIITFQRERFYRPTALESRLCLYIAVVVLTAQLAMVLLAVRRRFKR
jgi:uncharacterized protein YjbI with pentapeptide repeats